MDDEIDLRVYADLLWRHRQVIVAVTAGAAIVAFAVSRFILPKAYEASALFVVETRPFVLEARAGWPDELPADNSSDRARRVLTSLPPPLDARGYQELVKSDAFQDEIARRARSLFGGTGRYKVEASVIPQTALLKVSAEAPRPEQAAKLANEAAALLLQEADRLNRQRLQAALSLLENQTQQARTNLDEATRRLQAFTRSGPSVDDLQNELNGKLQLLAEYKNRLTQLHVVLRSETAKLKYLRNQLEREPQRYVLKKALTPEATGLSQALNSLGLSGKEPLMSLEDEQLNPVYVELRQQAATQEAAVAALEAEREMVESAIGQLSSEVQRLTTELVTLRARQQELTSQVEMARRIYATVAAQYETQKGLMAAKVGESALSLVKPAPPPEAPARPRPLLNAVVAGFLGLMAGVTGVLFAEFWRQPVGATVAGPVGAQAQELRH